MTAPPRKRLSFSPEKLTLAGRIYSIESACARTFFILGETVVWSHAPHIQIISCFRTMKDASDLKTARRYGVHFAGKLTHAEFDRFRNRLTGVLGENRRRNKAGRIWLGVSDEDNATVAVASFWAKRRSISDGDIDLLRRAFGVKYPIWVDYIDRVRSVHFCGPPP